MVDYENPSLFAVLSYNICSWSPKTFESALKMHIRILITIDLPSNVPFIQY